MHRNLQKFSLALLQSAERVQPICLTQKFMVYHRCDPLTSILQLTAICPNCDMHQTGNNNTSLPSAHTSCKPNEAIESCLARALHDPRPPLAGMQAGAHGARMHTNLQKFSLALLQSAERVQPICLTQKFMVYHRCDPLTSILQLTAICPNCDMHQTGNNNTSLPSAHTSCKPNEAIESCNAHF